MKTDSGTSASVWMATATIPAQSSLAEDVRADVCIIGAGIAGMTTAYMLSLAGKSVIVLDDGPIAGGDTCRTTAHLSTSLDDPYYDLERTHGECGAHLAAASHTAAIDRIEQIVKEEGIDCDFQRLDGYLVAPPGVAREQLDHELRAARRAGLAEIESVERVPYDAYDFGAALRFPHQGQLHALKYMVDCGDPESWRLHLHEDACDEDRGRQRRAHRNQRGPSRHGRCGGRGDEYARQ